MRQRQVGGPKLPKELRDKFGDPANHSNKSNGRNAPPNRKDRRKLERTERKTQKRQPPAKKSFRNINAQEEDDEEEKDMFDKGNLPPPSTTIISTRAEPNKPVKGILKKAKSRTENETPPASPPRIHVSRATKDRIAEDDAEIRALEKKLGIQSKKKAKPSEDGLDDIFGDLDAMYGEDDDPGRPAKRRRDDADDEWLASKRQKAIQPTENDSSEDDSEVDEEQDDSETEFISEGESDIDEEDLEDEDGDQDATQFDGFDTDDDNEVDKPAPPRVRENPYVAPVPASASQATKYVPPALRGPPSSDAEALARLRRQIQGLLNRLSDANMLTILKDIEQVYQNNARGYVNNTLIDLLMGLLADESTLLDTFIILHAGFIAAVYKVIGTDFGAQIVERIVTEIDRRYPENKSGSGKHTTNLMSVMSVLYNLQVIGSNLVFDYIRLFLNELSEINTELLLRMVRTSGTQLRQDDPTSLKDIVLLLQKSVAAVGENKLPVRTKFMIETINNLKNNRMKTGVAASAIVGEHTVRMKKQLGSLNTRNLKGTEPLRIGLADIKNTDKKGKWWLVGASWRNETAFKGTDEPETMRSTATPTGGGRVDTGEVDLIQLAKEQRMNTDVRRAIFISIMSATDFKDAHVRLLKLNLKKSQEMEIPRVIVHCAGCEANYNPYYTLLARKFCSDHRSRKCFQFALWDVFKSLGEKRDGGEDSDDDESTASNDISLRKLVNLGKLYGTLIAKDGLSITSLKPLNFAYLKPKTKTFIEILLVTVILESQKGVQDGRNSKSLLNIFINVDTAPEMVPGLQYFFRKVISRTDITASQGETETMRWACKVVGDMLTKLMPTATREDD